MHIENVEFYKGKESSGTQTRKNVINYKRAQVKRRDAGNMCSGHVPRIHMEPFLGT